MVVIAQERIEDDYGVSYQDGESLAVASPEAAAAEVLALAT